MKRFIIVGFIVAVTVVGLIFWQHFKHPSDAQARQLLPGTWHVDFSSAKQAEGKSTFVIAPNCDFTHKTVSPDGINTIESSGTFQVKHGVLIETITKSSYTNWHLPIVRTARIVRTDKREMVVIFEDTKDEFTIRKDAGDA